MTTRARKTRARQVAKEAALAAKDPELRYVAEEVVYKHLTNPRARKAAPVCCDCHGRAESICGGCGKPICGSELCLAAHEHSARKAAPNPHDQVRIEGAMPDHVAAYAVALHHAGVGSWGTVAVIVSRAFGMNYRVRELAAAGCAWARDNVAPQAKRHLRQLVKEAGRHP